MNLYSMEYFIAVAENLSFTKAADKVHISQTTMSFQIAAMEKELGFQLFKRNKRSVQLTPAGNSFYYSARHIVDSYKEAVQKAQKLASEIGRAHV